VHLTSAFVTFVTITFYLSARATSPFRLLDLISSGLIVNENANGR